MGYHLFQILSSYSERISPSFQNISAFLLRISAFLSGISAFPNFIILFREDITLFPEYISLSTEDISLFIWDIGLSQFYHPIQRRYQPLRFLLNIKKWIGTFPRRLPMLYLLLKHTLFKLS
jgi:hypothetical protein